MTMDRLTSRKPNGEAVLKVDNNTLREFKDGELPASKLLWPFVDRLAEYEDKIEQGKMVELPCKEGDEVYSIVIQECEECKYCNESHCPDECPEKIKATKFNLRMLLDIDKTIFITRKKAEAALRGRATNE
jgi:hypothetical protein